MLANLLEVPFKEKLRLILNGDCKMNGVSKITSIFLLILFSLTLVAAVAPPGSTVQEGDTCGIYPDGSPFCDSGLSCDYFQCVDTSDPTCSQKGGYVCTNTQDCDGYWITGTVENWCCSEKCTSPKKGLDEWCSVDSDCQFPYKCQLFRCQLYKDPSCRELYQFCDSSYTCCSDLVCTNGRCVDPSPDYSNEPSKYCTSDLDCRGYFQYSTFNAKHYMEKCDNFRCSPDCFLPWLFRCPQKDSSFWDNFVEDYSVTGKGIFDIAKDTVKDAADAVLPGSSDSSDNNNGINISSFTPTPLLSVLLFVVLILFVLSLFKFVQFRFFVISLSVYIFFAIIHYFTEVNFFTKWIM